jgi:phosphatidylethanolamine-binding protein (PEBP) family uncharacterized protein
MANAQSQNEHFIAWSRSLKSGETVPNNYVFSGHGCGGKNISPPLEWDGAPSGTKGFAITVFDPDAPTDHGWWHWAVLNIPANIHKIEEGASNEGKLPLSAVEVSLILVMLITVDLVLPKEINLIAMSLLSML